MKEYERLPDGSSTCSDRRYVREWRKFARLAVRHLGVHTHGYGADHVSFVDALEPKKHPSIVQIPCWLLARINAALDAAGRQT